MSTNPRIPRYTVTLLREKNINVADYVQVSNSDKAAAILREETKNFDREHFIVVTFDSKNKILGINIVHIGGLASSLVLMRETFKMAVIQNAAAIIHAHNHPSGLSTPSQEDWDVHNRLMKSGIILGIKVLDGIIVGEDDYFAFGDMMQHPYADMGNTIRPEGEGVGNV